MGENLKEDRQRGEVSGERKGRLFLVTHFFYCQLVKKKKAPFFQKKHPISDRQLFSSYMQIPLDSAKPSP